MEGIQDINHLVGDNQEEDKNLGLGFKSPNLDDQTLDHELVCDQADGLCEKLGEMGFQDQEEGLSQKKLGEVGFEDQEGLIGEKGENIDLEGKKNDIEGEKINGVGEETDLEGEKIVGVGEKNDPEDKKIDGVGEKSDLKGEKNDFEGEKIDGVGEQNDLERENSDLGSEKNDPEGEKNDVEGDLNDGVGERSDFEGDGRDWGAEDEVHVAKIEESEGKEGDGEEFKGVREGGFEREGSKRSEIEEEDEGIENGGFEVKRDEWVADGRDDMSGYGDGWDEKWNDGGGRSEGNEGQRYYDEYEDGGYRKEQYDGEGHWHGSVDGGSVGFNDGNNGSHPYPLRPDAGDCSFYMRTGTCKYGSNCRFNHPLKRKNQAARDMFKKREDNFDGPRGPGPTECKYHSTPGGCKYGKARRYNHSRPKPPVAPITEFNFLGLPMRVGERECPYYMRTSSCKYGSNCRFNHPDPTVVGGGESASQGSVKDTIPAWSSARTLNEHAPAPYMPVMYPPSPTAPPNGKWNDYQMESGVKIEIHHGGEFAEKCGIKYYKGDESDDDKECGSEDMDGKEDMCGESCEAEEGDESDACEDSDSGEDSDYNESDIGEDSDIDDEFVEILKKKKEVYDSKKNPKEDDLRTLIYKGKKPKKAQKRQTVSASESGDMNDPTQDNWESEYDSDSNHLKEMDSTDSSDVGEVKSVKKNRLNKSKITNTFNPKTPMKDIKFEVGLVFSSVQELRYAIVDYAVAQKRGICYKKNDLQRLQAKCSENCPWYVFASKIDIDGAFQVKTYRGEHRCILVNKHQFLRSDWLAMRFGNKIRSNPKWKLREFQQHLNEIHGLLISKNRCFLAKRLALSEVEEKIAKQYRRLYDYGAELMRSNPLSTVKIRVDRPDLDSPAVFKGIYICFAAIKEGFSRGCRKIIGLDGCFLKSFVKGEVLSAIGRDGNSQMFPIAWAIVDVESTDTWEWFLHLLKEDLKLDNGFGYTFMTDQQKGLKHAIDTILPRAEHRCCARHIYANWKKNHPGAVLKTMFWKAAKSSTTEEFNLNMEEIKGISPIAHDDLLRTEPKYWSMAFFSTLTACDMVTNNLSECFNSWIIEARYKPILELLDDIRLQVMQRIPKKRDALISTACGLCPNIIKKLNYSIEASNFYKSTWTGGDEFEVRDDEGGQWVVNITDKTCSCRRWELRGIPCSHACQCLFSMNKNPEDAVDMCYSKSVYTEAYSHLLRPMKGSLYWPRTELPDILPPKARRMPRRPKKARRREQGEDGDIGKIGKKGIEMRCSQCLTVGHNKSTCKASAEEIAEKRSAAAETRKAHREALKAQSARNTKKKATSQKKNVEQGTQTGQSAKIGEAGQTKKRRGRPPKATNTHVIPSPPPLPPPGIGVFINSVDGRTYMTTPTGWH